MRHARPRDLCQAFWRWSPGDQGESRLPQHIALWGWYLACGLVVLISLIGCSAAIGRVVGEQFISPRYAFEVRLPGNTWQVVTGEPSVLTLSHPQQTAGMTIDVTCERERSVSLDILTRHLLFGFQDRQVLLQESRTLHGVPALKTITRARLDTQELLVSSYVIQHQGCVYDLVYFARPQDFSQSEADFERMVAQFRFLH